MFVRSPGVNDRGADASSMTSTCPVDGRTGQGRGRVIPAATGRRDRCASRARRVEGGAWTCDDAQVLLDSEMIPVLAANREPPSAHLDRRFSLPGVIAALEEATGRDAAQLERDLAEWLVTYGGGLTPAPWLPRDTWEKLLDAHSQRP